MGLEGKIIAIEGTDGSGKATQAAMLKDRLIREGKDVFSASFPNYESDSSAAVKMYLAGEIAATANEVSAKAASSFYAIDRYISYKRDIEAEYKEAKKVFVFDRYVSSNIIHQGAKQIAGLESGSKESENALKEMIHWVENHEHEDMGIPKPDVVIFLNVPVEYTIKLREQRANKITGEEKQDIHEADINHLLNASKSGVMAAELLGWNVIECVKAGQLRTIEDIHNEIYETISKY